MNGRASVCLFACLSNRSTAAAACGGFAELPSAGDIGLDRLLHGAPAVGAVQQAPALSSKRGSVTLVDSRQRRMKTHSRYIWCI